MKQAFLLLLVALPLAASELACADSLMPSGNTIFGEVRLLNRQGRIVPNRSDIVVFVEGLSASTRPPAHAPKMSHKGLRFAPRVLPIIRGQQIDFLNDDNVYHNVFSISKAKPFDLGIYRQGASRKLRFDTPGLVKVYCNIHPDMVSNILVLNNDRFALTDYRGRFEIRDVPDGNYRLRAWHESSAEGAYPIELRGGTRLEQSFELIVRSLPVQHKNKFGKPYDKKY